MFKPAAFLGQIPIRPAGLGCGGGFILPPSEPVEEEHVMGCPMHEPIDEEGNAIGCAKCKRRKKPDWTLEAQSSSEMVGTRRTERHGRLAGRILGQGAICSAKPPVISPDTNCQRTEAGDIICSNGVIYSGTCPNAPAVNYPGVAAGGATPKTPPYKGIETVTTPAPGGLVATPPETALPVVGILAGGVLVAGLAYLLLAK